MAQVSNVKKVRFLEAYVTSSNKPSNASTNVSLIKSPNKLNGNIPKNSPYKSSMKQIENEDDPYSMNIELLNDFITAYTPTEEDIARPLNKMELIELCRRKRPCVLMWRWNLVDDYVKRFRREGRLQFKTKKQCNQLIAKAVNRHKRKSLYTDEEMQPVIEEEWRERKKENLMYLDLLKYDKKMRTNVDKNSNVIKSEESVGTTDSDGSFCDIKNCSHVVEIQTSHNGDSNEPDINMDFESQPQSETVPETHSPRLSQILPNINLDFDSQSPSLSESVMLSPPRSQMLPRISHISQNYNESQTQMMMPMESQEISTPEIAEHIEIQTESAMQQFIESEEQSGIFKRETVHSQERSENKELLNDFLLMSTESITFDIERSSQIQSEEIECIRNNSIDIVESQTQNYDDFNYRISLTSTQSQHES